MIRLFPEKIRFRTPSRRVEKVQPMTYALLRANIVSGVKFGLFVAACFSVFVIVEYMVLGPNVTNHVGLSLQTVIETYFIGGIVCGTIGGIGRPLGRTHLGSIILGIFVTVIAYGSFGVAIYGLPTRWTPFVWWITILVGLFIGGFAGDNWYNKYS